MSLWKIAWRSIQQRALASVLTAVSMALGVALVVAVLVIHGVVSQSFRRNAGLDYNLVVGAKGGALQLVLNTVYHLSSPIENIPYSYYQEFVRDGGRFKPYVALAVPVCMGDYFQNFRVIGTTPDLFDKLGYTYGEKYQFAQGRNFRHENFFEAVVGSAVARSAGLKLHDKIQVSHGASDGHQHDDEFTVVGILAPTGTPNDRAVFVNMEGFYLLDNHALPPAPGDSPPAHDHPPGEHYTHAHQPLPESQREVTALLVRSKSDLLIGSLQKMINKDKTAQVVQPIKEIYRLLHTFVQPVQIVLLVLTVLVVVVSGVGILVSIYNSMNDRRHEIAVLRALGARRRTVLAVVLCESILLAVLGGLGGWLLGHLAIAAAQDPILAQTGVSVGLLHFVVWEWVIIPCLVVLASLAGLVPALVAYRTDVASALATAP
jgi:putative ABC transport system permease protein